MKNITHRKGVAACPSCGLPVQSQSVRFKINETVKLLLVLLIIAYIVISIILLAASMPLEMRRGCNRNLPEQQPKSCQYDEIYLLLQPLYKETAYQIFIGGGLITGILIFYWDWFQHIYENWKKKREPSMEISTNGKKYKYECRHCGKRWN